MEIGVYTASLGGHRKSYLELVLKLFPSKRVDAKELFRPTSLVLFLMIEDSFMLYFLVCMWRSLIGKETAGLLFRPKPVVESASLRLKIKKIALYYLKKKSNVKTILIVPQSAHPKFLDISDGWIYDFQFWDLQESDYQMFMDIKSGNNIAPLFSAIHELRGNRNVLCALGRQDRIKGFDVFANTYINEKDVRSKFLFAYGGKVKGFDKLADKFENAGGFGDNRFVSDDDLISLYAASNLVWSLYAEDYDQASGIFGRAVQLGIPVIVRRGSLIHQICEIENIPNLPTTKDDTSKLSTIAVQAVDVKQGKEFRDRFKEQSIKQLSEILGVERIGASLDG